MFDLLCLVLFVVVGVLLHRRRPELARRIARSCPLILAGLLIGLLVTGAHRPGDQTSPTHRWLGHAMVSFSWVALPFCFGVLLARERRGLALTKSLIVFVSVALITFESITGYLVPWDQMTIVKVINRPGEGSPSFGGFGIRPRLAIDDIAMITSEPDARFNFLGKAFVSEITLNRFILLHMIFTPALIALSLLGWLLAFRPKRVAVAVEARTTTPCMGLGPTL
jgi:hypothetical protein